MREHQSRINKVEKLMRRVGEELVAFAQVENPRDVGYKKGKEIVSKLDIAAEQKIKTEIQTIFPEHKIWGEELGKDSGDLEEENFIIIDSIDGTKNYLSGVPLYASQIACIERGEPVWGIIVLPALKETFVGIRGKGALLNGRKIEPSKQTDLSLANQCFGLGHEAENIINLPILIKPHLAEPRQYGSAGVHFAFTACGRIDIYIASEAAFYDIAPGLIICQEAGLEACDLDGNEYNIGGGKKTGIVVANKKLIEGYKKAIGKNR